MEAECQLFAATRGLVTAPAGCGKTHLIGIALRSYTCAKPVLILTHTNAGVAAMRDRLQRASVDTRKYRLSTIDGWLMRLIATFPARSGHAPKLLDIRSPKNDYPEIRRRALALLAAGHVSDVIRSSYAHLIVDEYQDCSVTQHRIMQHLTALLPSCVLGDPMQAIFNFSEPVAHWDNEVRSHFQEHAYLTTPWRWRNAGAEPLGQWLLYVRGQLEQGRPIDIRQGPSKHVTWIATDAQQGAQRRLQAASTKPAVGDHRVLVIGDAMRVESRHMMAASTPGAVVVEAVDLKELVAFAEEFTLTSASTEMLLAFAERMLTHSSAKDMLRRIETLSAGRARKPANSAEQAALDFMATPSWDAAVKVLLALHEQPQSRVVRPAIFFAAIKALRRTQTCQETFVESAIAVREESRLFGRPLPKRGVGSTLLLKGLEAEVAVILEGDRLDRQNLYVAMTRGSTQLVVCSEDPVLGRH